ncbi:serine/threonine-protein kinase RIO1-like [Schistocerca gregaria]|uniref:serine/threonine-protein kinase RIO1-like n=1 Tax=Schistocerca gregaria TaxID=7010 RepID=UPI00211F3F5A|nr:serine/threonine-protein kinase RIO1-like [Schistocerca gregaria]
MCDNREQNSRQDEEIITDYLSRNDVSLLASRGSVMKRFQPLSVQKCAARINVDSIVYSATGVDFPDHIVNSVKERIRRDGAGLKSRERADRATVEQVLDPRTRMILYKLINKGAIRELNGCISTGKEANVYHATTEKMGEFGEFGELAVKVFKTSILVFKDRDRYVSGEFRFRRGYSRQNPRKMVRVWAEKEMRNLVRMNLGGIPCPRAIMLRQHILIMSFIGSDSWGAPLLKETELSLEQYSDAYRQVVRNMRLLYQRCHLIHADLSEYNILYYEGTCYFIDVGQAVEYDHPNALEFLRRDAENVNRYFRKKGVLTVTSRDLFEFVCDLSILEDQMEDTISTLQARSDASLTGEQEVEQNVFMKSFIPRTLFEISGEGYLQDRYNALTGNDRSVYYRKVSGLNRRLTGAAAKNELLEESEEEEDLERLREDALMMKRALESYHDNFLFYGSEGDSCSDVDEQELSEGSDSEYSSEREDALSPVADTDRGEQGDLSDSGEQGDLYRELASVRLEVSSSGDGGDDSSGEASCANEESDEEASPGDEAPPTESAPARNVRVVQLTKEERKAHKKAVKKVAAEKRKVKIPKHVKKRAKRVAMRR